MGAHTLLSYSGASPYLTLSYDLPAFHQRSSIKIFQLRDKELHGKKASEVGLPDSLVGAFGHDEACFPPSQV